MSCWIYSSNIFHTSYQTYQSILYKSQYRSNSVFESLSEYQKKHASVFTDLSRVLMIYF